MNSTKLKRSFAKEWLIILGLCILTLPISGVMYGVESWQNKQWNDLVKSGWQPSRDEIIAMAIKHGSKLDVSPAKLENMAPSPSFTGYCNTLGLWLFFVIPAWIATIFIRVTIWCVRIMRT